MKRVLRSQADFKSTLLRNQLTSLILFESITTTRAKAAALVAFANRFFNRVRAKDMNAIRLANQVVFDKNAAKKIFEEILPRYTDSATSYLRVLRVHPRAGDAAEMRLVLLQQPLTVSTEKKTAKKVTAKAKK